MTQMKILKGHMTRVHIENVFQFNFLKRDGDVETKTDELYPIKDMAQICSVERRVLLYLDHDMVT
jgi:sentrin-specific protease 1